MYNEDNIFYKIIKKEIPAKIIFENDTALSFYDINPLAKIHALVIPKGKYVNVLDFATSSQSEQQGLLEAVAKTVELLNLKEGGFRLISNCGINGGQEVPHLHFHILGGERIGKMVSKV
ncbi:MAG: histidine triad nucleotide-binding protein [Alphaproteobacteria bacterium]|jgi:diadenosine tetraphosphate (Ap4A) HIT family hydrolase|nr:histidine triad nucleotide-binding protein [Alphaproteobacteria bacterium]